MAHNFYYLRLAVSNYARYKKYIMKSRITIEVDFNNGNQPVLQILHMDSDDVRDKLISSFTQYLGGSSWCQIKWVGGGVPQIITSGQKDGHFDFSRIFITPIPESKLKEQAEIMLKQHELNESYKGSQSADPK